jgi:hypothetical protein
MHPQCHTIIRQPLFATSRKLSAHEYRDITRCKILDDLRTKSARPGIIKSMISSLIRPVLAASGATGACPRA